jgi:hypothetical protein
MGRDRSWSRRLGSRLWTSQFAVSGASLRPLFGLRGGNLRLNSRQVLGALPFLFGAFRFDACGFCGRGFASGRGFGCCLRGSGVFFGCSLDISSLATTSNRRFGGNNRRGGRLGSGGVRATASRCLSGCRRRAFRAHSLFALPARADASYLVVAEHAHMAANRDVHLPKQTDDLIGRNPEFVRQLADCELAQTSSPILLARGGLGATSSRTPAANCRSVIPTTAV